MPRHPPPRSPRFARVASTTATASPGVNRSASVRQVESTEVGATTRNGRVSPVSRACAMSASIWMRLAESHVVGEDPAEAVLPQEREPLEAGALVGPQLRAQARRQRRRRDPIEVTQRLGRGSPAHRGLGLVRDILEVRPERRLVAADAGSGLPFGEVPGLLDQVPEPLQRRVREREVPPVAEQQLAPAAGQCGEQRGERDACARRSCTITPRSNQSGSVLSIVDTVTCGSPVSSRYRGRSPWTSTLTPATASSAGSSRDANSAASIPESVPGCRERDGSGVPPDAFDLFADRTLGLGDRGRRTAAHRAARHRDRRSARRGRSRGGARARTVPSRRVRGARPSGSWIPGASTVTCRSSRGRCWVRNSSESSEGTVDGGTARDERVHRLPERGSAASVSSMRSPGTCEPVDADVTDRAHLLGVDDLAIDRDLRRERESGWCAAPP